VVAQRSRAWRPHTQLNRSTPRRRLPWLDDRRTFQFHTSIQTSTNACPTRLGGLCAHPERSAGRQTGYLTEQHPQLGPMLRQTAQVVQLQLGRLNSSQSSSGTFPNSFTQHAEGCPELTPEHHAVSNRHWADLPTGPWMLSLAGPTLAPQRRTVLTRQRAGGACPPSKHEHSHRWGRRVAIRSVGV